MRPSSSSLFSQDESNLLTSLYFRNSLGYLLVDTSWFFPLRHTTHEFYVTLPLPSPVVNLIFCASFKTHMPLLFVRHLIRTNYLPYGPVLLGDLWYKITINYRIGVEHILAKAHADAGTKLINQWRRNSGCLNRILPNILLTLIRSQPNQKMLGQGTKGNQKIMWKDWSYIKR